MSRVYQQQAKRDAERARSRAFWHYVTHGLRGMPNELLPFSAVKGLRPQGENYSGVKAIAIKQIVGSVDRYRDFDHYFLPRVSHTLERWTGIRQAGLEGKELPPISVYKVGEVFFVKDGHHRVSVARSAGQQFIDAEIIELSVSVPPHSSDTLKEVIIKGEYADFLERTGLKALCPEARPLLFTVTGRYDVLLEHIRTRQYYLGRSLERNVSWDEAVTSWYQELYEPVARQAQEHHVLRRFPGRTEADLYLWIMDHRYYLSQHYGRDVDSETAATDFSARYAKPPFLRLAQRLAQRWRGVRRPSL